MHKPTRKNTAQPAQDAERTSTFSLSLKVIQVGMKCSTSVNPLAPGIAPSCVGRVGGVVRQVGLD